MAVFGDDTGFVVFALGINPRRNPKTGRYEHEYWSERSGEKIAFAWPEEAEQICEAIEQYGHIGDLHVVPYLRRSKRRAKGDAVILRLVHTDGDKGLDQEKIAILAELGAFVVGSGSPGNGHVHVPLDREVSQAEHEALCEGLIAYVDGDKAKHSDNDLLRPVGAYNLKSTVFDNLPARRVHWVVKPNGKRVDPRTLADLLGVDLDAAERAKTNRQGPTGDRAKTEEFDLDQYPALKVAVHKNSGDRSADMYGVMGACCRANLTFAQACWAVYQSPRLTERLDERGEDHKIDLLRCWCRAVDDQQREAQKNGDGKADPGGFEQDVSGELRKLRVREEAKRRFLIEKAGDAPPFEALLLADTPLFSEESFRIEGLLPSKASMVVNAQHKTGKTTLILNMSHSLITSEPFLGKFRVHPVDGRVAILNYEVSGPQLGHWARQAGIPEDRLLQVNLRGRRNPFAYPDDLDRLAGLLKAHEVEALIVDPFGQAYPGTDQDGAGEVGAWLADLNLFARTAAGVADLIMTVHSGWNQERARGSSALGDWPDSILCLTRSDKTDERYLRATGRDVALDEDRLDYHPETRRLSLSGTGGRRQARQGAPENKPEALVLPVHLHVFSHPGASVGEIIGDLRKLKDAGKLGVSFGFHDQDVRDAIELAEAAGKLRREDQGPGKPTLHYPLTTPEEEPGQGEGGEKAR